MEYDFCGWASKNNLRCSDGRVIRTNAFANDDGKTVPLVWNHQHNSVDDVLGHALLENRPEGLYAYCSFNDTAKGQNAKAAVKHGDVTSMSIWANGLQEIETKNVREVLHGVVREVSLVLAGANPGAFVESVVAHGEPMEDGDEECILHTGDGIILSHAENDDPGSEESKKKEEDSDGEETLEQVLNSLNEKQRSAVAIAIGQAIADTESKDDDKKKEDEDLKHNIFEGAGSSSNARPLDKGDMEAIFKTAKAMGSLKEAVIWHSENEGGVLAHAIDTTGMDVATGTQTYGFNDPSMLFPEFKTLNNAPEWISRNMDWVQKVMSSVHHTPFSRIKSVYANITEDEARAKGYIKGNQKKDEVFSTLKRTTSPQTIYKRQKMDRDDILDITDFDVIAWIRAEMRVMLDEEIARAILLGDGRPADSEDKIKEDNIRPIAKDVPLFNVKHDVTVASSATEAEQSKEIIRQMIKARKFYKGSGNPTFFTTEDVLTEMLLLEDGIGHKLYKTEAELATAIRVSSIVTVEPMDGYKVDDKPLLGIVVNLADYNVGADKGGEVNMFDDFDIDCNQFKYLIETRISGALVKPFSALTFLLNKGGASGASTASARSKAASAEG